MSNLYYVVHEKGTKKVKWKINEENILKYSWGVCVCMCAKKGRNTQNDKIEHTKRRKTWNEEAKGEHIHILI